MEPLIVILITFLVVVFIGHCPPIDNTTSLCGCHYKTKVCYYKPKESRTLVPMYRHVKVECSRHKKQTEGCSGPVPECRKEEAANKDT